MSPLTLLTLFPYTTLFRSAPVIGLMKGLTDPVVGLLMGQTAENLAFRFGITRREMDLFAARSHQRVLAAQKAGYFARSEEHTSELQSLRHLVCRLLLEKKN